MKNLLLIIAIAGMSFGCNQQSERQRLQQETNLLMLNHIRELGDKVNELAAQNLDLQSQLRQALKVDSIQNVTMLKVISYLGKK